MKQNLTHILIMSTIFVSSYIFFREPFEGYITYIVLALYMPLFISKFGIPVLPIVMFTPLLISGIIFSQLELNSYTLFTKIFIGFFASVIFYQYVFQLYRFDIKRLFTYYIKGSYYVSVLGIFQLISFIVGFGPGYDFSWFLNKWSYTYGGLGIRMNSIFSEPAYFAAVIAPAFFVALYNLISRKRLYLTRNKSILIVVAYLLTFSSLGIIAIFFAVLLILINRGMIKYAIVYVPLFYFGFNFAYDNIPEFRDRYDGTFEVFSEQNITSYDVHGSSFVLYNNYHIALENFKRNWLFGTGLGSHPIAFEKYTLTNQADVVQITFNSADANSMLLRLMSETGIYGLSIMLYIVIRFWVFRRNSADDEMWVLSNAVSLIILLYLARQGHYFLNGFPFFLWLHYYIWKENKARKLAKLAEVTEPEEEGLEPGKASLVSTA
jgi:hypothetical protein